MRKHVPVYPMLRKSAELNTPPSILTAGQGKYPDLSPWFPRGTRFHAPSQGFDLSGNNARKHKRITVTALCGNFTQLP